MSAERKDALRFRCCICGGVTVDSPDYITMELAVEHLSTRQWFGAHGGCLNGVLAEGFSVEVHLM